MISLILVIALYGIIGIMACFTFRVRYELKKLAKERGDFYGVIADNDIFDYIGAFCAWPIYFTYVIIHSICTRLKFIPEGFKERAYNTAKRISK